MKKLLYKIILASAAFGGVAMYAPQDSKKSAPPSRLVTLPSESSTTLDLSGHRQDSRYSRSRAGDVYHEEEEDEVISDDEGEDDVRDKKKRGGPDNNNPGGSNFLKQYGFVLRNEVAFGKDGHAMHNLMRVLGAAGANGVTSVVFGDSAKDAGINAAGTAVGQIIARLITASIEKQPSEASFVARVGLAMVIAGTLANSAEIINLVKEWRAAKLVDAEDDERDELTTLVEKPACETRADRVARRLAIIVRTAIAGAAVAFSPIKDDLFTGFKKYNTQYSDDAMGCESREYL